MSGEALEAAFRPTHRVAGEELATYGRPDPAAAPGARLTPHLEVRVIEQHPDGWAQVQCSNGWTTWVDGRRLVALSPPPAVGEMAGSSAAWVPSHRVPQSGLPTWTAPDPGAAAGQPLDAGLAVQLLERRPDGWARVACSNGWTAWVDGRLLGGPDAGPASAATPGASPAWLPWLGCVLIAAGAVAPWYRLRVGSISASRLPVRYLVLRTPGLTQPRVAPLLFAAAGLVAVGALLQAGANRREGRLLLLVGAVIATNLGLFGVMRWLHPATGLGLGLGVPLTAVGGALVVVAHLRTRDRARQGPWALL